MTREEAIVVLEESKRQNEVMRDNPSTFWEPHQMDDGVKNSEKRISALALALAALRGPTREMVERVWFKEPHTRLGAWNRDDGATVYSAKNTCMSCGCETPIGNFCHNCGAALTDEAVDMMLERWKEALNGKAD